jgi:hypothetical protein
VQRWLNRCQDQRLDRSDWGDRSHAAQRPNRTSAKIEKEILRLRHSLKEQSALGEFGAAAILRELQRRKVQPCPGLRTIGRILQRRGAVDGRRRVRRPAPPRGWYLAPLAAAECEMDQFDTIEGLAIRGGPHLTVFTANSLHGGLCGVWPLRSFTARTAVTCLLEHWRTFGLPAYAQFDNDIRFLGPKQHRDCVGRVIRLCLSLGVTPVFAVPYETGFQAGMESFNGLWQKKVWARFEHRSLRTLCGRSTRYVHALQERRQRRRDTAPPRRRIPRRWKLDLQKPPCGRIIFLRRTDATGHVQLLGRAFRPDKQWLHRLVRVEVDLDHHEIRFYALRRREPEKHLLLQQIAYYLPNRPFDE